MAGFDGLVVWITGGGTGIGRSLALEVARQGARVAVSGRRQDRLDEVVTELAAAGREALAVACDVADEASCRAAVEAVVARFGRLDVAVANAGYGVTGKVADVPDATWRKQFDVNVFGLLNTIRVAVPHLKATRGRMVLVSSVAAFVYPKRNGAYTASKAAVSAIGNTLWAELDGSGVTCTTIHPGFVESEIGRVDNDGVFRPERADKRPKALFWTSDSAARAMARGILSRRRIFVFTGHGHVVAWLARTFPWVTSQLMRRLT